MPRKYAYEEWTSATVLVLKNLLTDGDTVDTIKPDFREPGKKNKAGIELHSVEGGKGRPHREEAMLLQAVGDENETACKKCLKNEGAFLTCRSAPGVKRGACGNCLWDSKDIDCNLPSVRTALEAEIRDKEQLKDLKLRKAAVSGPVSSKRKRGGKVDLTQGSDGEQVVTTKRSRKQKAHDLRPRGKKNTA